MEVFRFDTILEKPIKVKHHFELVKYAFYNAHIKEKHSGSYF